MVKDVVALRAENQFELLEYGLGLLEDDIGIHKAGPIELVPMNGNILVERGIRERGSSWASDYPLRRLGAPPCRVRRAYQ